MTPGTPGAALRRGLARIGRAIAGLPPRAVLGIAWAIAIIYAYPGQMTLDSLDHLKEARISIYSDAHPPIISLIWKFCEYIVAGPFGVLLLQTGLLLAALYAIFARSFEPRRAAWWAAAVFVSPPVLAVMAVIWKDCSMAALLAVGAACLLSNRRGVKLAGLVAITVAAALRYNAFGATLPLVVLLFEWRPGMHWLRRYALATAVWLATTFAAFGINEAITDKSMHYWHSSLAVYDIVGTLARVERQMSDEELRAQLAGTELQADRDIHARIRAVYSTISFFSIVKDPALALWKLPISGHTPAPRSQREAIERAWWHTITSYPREYLVHRLAVTAEALDLRTSRSLAPITAREYRHAAYADELGLSTVWSSTQHKLTRWMKWLSRHTPLFVPWVYLVLTLVLLPLAWRQRDMLTLLLSGLGMEATLIPLVHSRDYRYSHWMVITTMIGCIVVTTRRYRAARAARLLLVGDKAGLAAARGAAHEAAL